MPCQIDEKIGDTGVVSLLELLMPLFTRQLVFSVAYAARSEAVLHLASTLEVLSDDCDRSQLTACVAIIRQVAEAYELTSTLHKCDRFKRIIERIEYPPSDDLLASELKELQERLEDDLRSQTFLHVPARQAEQYASPLASWETVAGRFPKAVYNIEESSRCFALERFGAAVFHVLQVAEYGVIQVADLMGMSGDKPGWSSLKRLKTLTDVPYPQRTPDAKLHTKLLENVVPLALVIKDSWRHKLDHVDNQIIWVDTDFSAAVANEIILATRAFMRKLALELP